MGTDGPKLKCIACDAMLSASPMPTTCPRCGCKISTIPPPPHPAGERKKQGAEKQGIVPGIGGQGDNRELPDAEGEDLLEKFEKQFPESDSLHVPVPQQKSTDPHAPRIEIILSGEDAVRRFKKLLDDEDGELHICLGRGVKLEQTDDLQTLMTIDL